MDIKKLINSGVAHIKPYAPGKPQQDSARRENRTPTIKMNANENPLGTSKSALDAAQTALSKAHTYPESSSKALRATLARSLGVSASNIIIGNGSDEILYYIAMGFIDTADEVIIPRITFPVYEIASRIMRADVVSSTMDRYAIDRNDILNRITRRTKLIFFSNPNNPTGHMFPHREIAEFLQKVPPHALVVVDEAYKDFADIDDIPDTISLLKQGANNLIIVRTLSKSHGFAGMRVGYSIASEAVIEILNRIRIPFNITIVSQHAALAAIEDDTFVKRSVDFTRKQREQIYETLERLGVSYVRSHTNFILIDTGRDSDHVTDEFLRRGILVRNAKDYGLPTSIRITVGTEEQNRAFLKAFEEIMAD